ncbi:MAG: hypothetical protein KDK64_02150 [Chlamydiia bacterium]|nr:hypothetical protein [Chlamydiia bacterium]
MEPVGPRQTHQTNLSTNMRGVSDSTKGVGVIAMTQSVIPNSQLRGDHEYDIAERGNSSADRMRKALLGG